MTEMIATRQQWQGNGIRTTTEDVLFSALDQILRDRKVQEAKVPRWNWLIAEYEAEARRAESEDAKLLMAKKLELCTKADIRPPMFVTLMDLLLREFAVRGALALIVSRDVCPVHIDRAVKARR
jgi:hypothetical protein